MTDNRDIPFGRPWITEDDRLAGLEVLKGHILTHDRKVKDLRRISQISWVLVILQPLALARLLFISRIFRWEWGLEMK